MPYSIICFSKTLSLAFTVNLLWCQVYTLNCPLRKKRFTVVHIQQHIHQNDVIICLALYYYGNVIVELEKQIRNLAVFMVLIILILYHKMLVSSTLKFVFVYGFNECLWATFWKFLILYLEVVVWLLILWHTPYIHAHK